MRRLGAACAAVAALASLAWAGAQADVGPAPARVRAAAAPARRMAPPGQSVEAAPWALQSVARDQRTLYVRYVAAGCQHDGAAEVSESASAVTVEVTELTPTAVQPCPALARIAVLGVALPRPIAGRRLAGNQCAAANAAGCPPAGPVELFRNGDVLRQVPRLIGLSVSDARTTLRRQGFRVRVRGRGSGREVVSEHPGPGSAMGLNDNHPIVLGRGSPRAD